MAAVRGEAQIQIDAPISPGSSGGPVFDGSGQLVGIATSSIIGGQNLNFAVPSRFIAEMPMVAPMPVKEVGALAISDREYAHLKGPVRSYTETITDMSPETGPELTSAVLTFDRSGRTIQESTMRKEYRTGGRSMSMAAMGSCRSRSRSAQTGNATNMIMKTPRPPFRR